MIRSGIELDDKWLYILDATPTFVGVMAFAIILPFDLPYAAMFKRGNCRRRDMEVGDAEGRRNNESTDENGKGEDDKLSITAL